jgi:hypothetical protein
VRFKSCEQFGVVGVLLAQPSNHTTRRSLTLDTRTEWHVRKRG